MINGLSTNSFQCDSVMLSGIRQLVRVFVCVRARVPRRLHSRIQQLVRVFVCARVRVPRRLHSRIRQLVCVCTCTRA